MNSFSNETRIAIVGPGYVGLPLALEYPQFLEMGGTGKTGAVLFDVKKLFPAEESDGRL